MNSKFIKKLKKEIKKSPGKAALLALLFVVAVWFWAPLLPSLVGSEGSVPATAQTAAAQQATGTKPAAASTAKQFSWKEIADAIDRDPKMRPVAFDDIARDPFRPAIPPEPKIVEQPKPIEPQVVVPDVDPSDAGLVLRSTIVGPRSKLARINGKSYHEGDIVEAWGADQPLEYRVVSIGGKSVVLELAHREYELRMTKAPSSFATSSTTSVSSDSPEFDPSIFE